MGEGGLWGGGPWEPKGGNQHLRRLWEKKRPALFKNSRHMKGREAPIDCSHPSPLLRPRARSLFFSFRVALP